MPTELDQHPYVAAEPRYLHQKISKPSAADQQEHEPAEQSFSRISLSFVDSNLEGRL